MVPSAVGLAAAGTGPEGTPGAADPAGGGVGGGEAAQGVPVVLGQAIEEVRVHGTSVRSRGAADEWQE